MRPGCLELLACFSVAFEPPYLLAVHSFSLYLFVTCMRLMLRVLGSGGQNSEGRKFHQHEVGSGQCTVRPESFAEPVVSQCAWEGKPISLEQRSIVRFEQNIPKKFATHCVQPSNLIGAVRFLRRSFVSHQVDVCVRLIRRYTFLCLLSCAASYPSLSLSKSNPVSTNANDCSPTNALDLHVLKFVF